MNGYCNMCGKCCEAITLWISPEELMNHNQDNTQVDESTDRGWAKEHFKPITKEEAFKRNPLHAYLAQHDKTYETVHFYECDMYDKKTHRCTAHDRRPRVCWGYPHYERGQQLPGTFTPYSATCDYIHDMPPAMKQEWIAVAEELKRLT